MNAIRLKLRRRVAEEAAKSSFDETLESIANTPAPMWPNARSKSWSSVRPRDFDAFYQLRAGGCQPQDRCWPSASMARGLSMRTEDLREQTRKAAEQRTHKMGKRLSKGEKKNAKRMATVAAVYTIAPLCAPPKRWLPKPAAALPVHRGPVRSKNACGPVSKKSPKQVIAQAFAEARQRDPTGEKTWVALVDGNKAQIRSLAQVWPARKRHRR